MRLDSSASPVASSSLSGCQSGTGEGSSSVAGGSEPRGLRGSGAPGTAKSDVISSSGQIINVYEKKGSHYMQSDQLVIANHKTPIALFRRTSIYAVRAAAA